MLFRSNLHVYLLAHIVYDPITINATLSCLSQDHLASIACEAYHVFYDEHGICRLYSYDSKRLNGIMLPECINNQAYVQARFTLNNLVRIKAVTPEAKRQVTTALKYIEQACLDKTLRDEYTAIATAMCNAMIIKEFDKDILFLDKFIELNETEEQRAIRPSLMRDAIMLYEKINQPNISEETREDYRKKLYIVDKTCKLLNTHKDKQSALSKFYNEKIKPLLVTISAYELGIIYAQFLYNEIATPSIPTVDTPKKSEQNLKDSKDENTGDISQLTITTEKGII